MPFYSKYKCDNCTFCKVVGEPESLYITTVDGERVDCPHIGENTFIAKILNLDEEETWSTRYHAPSWYWRRSRKKRHNDVKELIDSRVGKVSHCICDKCHEFDLDYKKDVHKCPVCSSYEVIRVLDLAERVCPECRAGCIEKIGTGVIT